MYVGLTFFQVMTKDPSYCWNFVMHAAKDPESRPNMLRFAEYLHAYGFHWEGRAAYDARVEPEKVNLSIDLASYKTVASLAGRFCSNAQKADYYNMSYADIVARYIENYVKADPQDETHGWVLLEYRPDRLGHRLIEEGILEGARLYSGRSDPLSLPSDINDVLTDRYYINMDDSKAHPSYMRALTQMPEAQAVLDDYLSDTISLLESVAEHYLREVSAESMSSAKVLFLSLGMDGSVTKWRQAHGVEANVAEHAFVERYASIMPIVTDEFTMLPGASRAMKIMQAEFGRHLPKRTWKSFLLQEIEFVARRAKVRVANMKYHGHGALEHDGIRLIRGPKTEGQFEELERDMTEAVTEEVHEFLKKKYKVSGEPFPIKVKIKTR